MKETYRGWSAEQYTRAYISYDGYLNPNVDSLNTLRSSGVESPIPYSEVSRIIKEAFDAAREAGMLDPVAFPQPELKAPMHDACYFYVSLRGTVDQEIWNGASYDHDLLKAGNVYLSRELAEQRILWNRQEMKHYVAPQWFRDLGPEFLFRLSDGSWVKKKSADFTNFDMLPEDFKALPKDVVHVLNGKEYRWPALVYSGTRYCIEAGAIVVARHDKGHKDYKDAITELEYCFALRIADLRAQK